MITVVVGDVHGCHDKLISLLAQCRLYVGEQPHRFVFLGDYIDRGPASRRVIEVLLELETTAHPPPIFLRGNHEQMMLDAIHDPSAELQWYVNGGEPTLASYGVSSVVSI